MENSFMIYRKNQKKDGEKENLLSQENSNSKICSADEKKIIHCNSSSSQTIRKEHNRKKGDRGEKEEAQRNL